MAKKKQYKSDKEEANEEYGEGSPIVKYILECRNAAKEAKWNRIQQTRENFDCYFLRHDFSHKLPGQSREVLSMQPMAVEQTAAFFQQALTDMGDQWWSADYQHPQNVFQASVTTEMVKSVTQMNLLKADILKHVTEGMKSGLLGGKIITKVHGDYFCVPRYVAKRKKGKREADLEKQMKWAWKLRLDVVSQFNYYPDPTPTNHKKLFEIEDMWMDYADVCKLAEGDDAIYDHDIVELIENKMDDEAEARFDEIRRTNQLQDDRQFRGRVKLTEFWGDILNEEGERIYENVVCTIANDRWLIRPPTANPLWHQESPYVEADLLDIPDAVWPKALMDAPTKHNMAATELYNLMVDGGMRAANGVGMIRQDWLEDPSQVEGGIRPGASLMVNSQCPPGAKVLEMVQTGNVPPDAQAMFNIINQEFNRAALTSDIRQGMQPREQVSATQVVEANQTITSVFQGMAKNVEQQWIQKLLEKAWMTCCQYSDLMDEDELRTIIGPSDADKYLNLTPQERFAESVNGIKFRVNGISLTLKKSQDARRYMTLLQTIGGNEVLMEEFVKGGYSVGELLKQIIHSLGIDTRAIELPQSEKEMMKQSASGSAPPMQGPGAAAPGAGAQDMTQATSPNTGSLMDQMGSAAPGAQVPHQGFHKGQQ